MTASKFHKKKPKIAMVLAGCGVYEGSECTETISLLIHLSRHRCDVQMFAPDQDQMHAVNHVTGEEHEETRNCLVESARLARGQIQDLAECQADEFDGLVVPGGFGVAKNLSNFAVTAGAGKGVEGFAVDPVMKRVIRYFYAQKKPIGMTCIAPVLVARLVPGVTLTMGMDVEGDDFPYAGCVGAVQKLGAQHVNTPAPCTSAVVDEANLIVTAPAYMYNAQPHEVYDSAGAMVDQLLKLLK